MLKLLTVLLVCVAIGCPAGSAAQTLPPTSASIVRTYYVAADEVEWDYAPGGVNRMMGMKFEGNSSVFTERGPHRIGLWARQIGFPRRLRRGASRAQESQGNL
jgi:hypothetical protein